MARMVWVAAVLLGGQTGCFWKSQENSRPKVIAGELVDAGSPVARSTVSLAYDDGVAIQHFCTGVIVSRRHVLTAGHCFHPPGSADFADRTFSVRSTRFSLFGYHFKLADVTFADEWKSSVEKYPDLNLPSSPAAPLGDLALVTLAQDFPAEHPAVEFAPADLPAQTPGIPDDNVFFIAGHGWSQEINAEGAGMPSADLRKAGVRLSSLNSSAREVIVLPLEPTQGVCSADSGGPLFLVRGEQIFLVGTLSRSPAGRCAGQPAVYTDARLYADWIRSVAK